MPKNSKNKKSCYGCNVFGVCKVQEVAGELLKLLGSVSIDNSTIHTDLAEFVGEHCRLHIPITEEENLR